MGPDIRSASELWLVCHGYGQLASRFIRRFGVIDNGRRLIVAPEALSRFYLTGGSGPHSAGAKVGASWMTREDRDAEIADQVTYLDLVLRRALDGVARSGVRVVGFGFSQGAATICRWAARTADPPDQVVAWGAGVPAELLGGPGRAGLARARLTIVAGSSDAVGGVGRAELHRRELEVAGLSCQFVGYDGGHALESGTLAMLATRVSRER